MMPPEIQPETWQAQTAARKQILRVLFVCFLYFGLLRVSFTEWLRLNNLFLTSSLILLAILSISESFRNQKLPLCLLMIFWIGDLVLLTAALAVSISDHQEWLSEHNHEFFLSRCLVPIKITFELMLLITVPVACGFDRKIVFRVTFVTLALTVGVVAQVINIRGTNNLNWTLEMMGIVIMTAFLLCWCVQLVDKKNLTTADLLSHLIQQEREAQQKRYQSVSYTFHEVRNTINSVGMAADVAIQMLPIREDNLSLRELVEGIIKTTDQATKLLNDILDVQRGSNGNLSFQSSPFLIQGTFDHVVRMMRYQMQHKNIRLEYEIDPKLEDVVVSGDESRLQQVIQNILGNAYKFTPEGGSVTVRVEQFESVDDTFRLRTSITDTGPGISGKDKENIFQPWMQSKAGRASGHGTGLGLAISKSIVEYGFGGTIDFATSSSGTTFFFEIMFRTLSIDSLADSPPSCGVLRRAFPRLNSAAVSANDGESEVVVVDAMVVDDSLMNRELLSRMLQTFGLSAVTCSNGQEAISLLIEPNEKKVRCKVVFLDQEMPEMDGMEAARLLREHSFSGHVIGLTGNTLESQISEFISSGVSEVLVKPLRRRTLEDLLQRIGLIRSTQLPTPLD
eukprot:c8953_g1_i1.p1 GENE.c8953_g1_i1~~c8953_g1_i1.p1  ORF type:complete len:622 (-),score=153.85 c8953_g1_i1:35-1900(-)